MKNRLYVRVIENKIICEFKVEPETTRKTRQPM